MMQRTTIGYHDDSPGPGGTTRYLTELLGALDRSRFDVVFFASNHYEWHEGLRALGARMVTGRPAEESAPASPAPEPAPARARPRKSIIPREVGLSRWLASDLVRLVRLFRQERVDILHTNHAGTEPAPIAARLAGVPRVLGTWHVDSTYDLLGERQGFWYRSLERASLRALHGAIAVSRATRDDWLLRCGLGASYLARTTVVYNGIAPERLERRRAQEAAKAALGISPDTVVVASMGRLEPAKGYEYLIRALPRLTHRPQPYVVAIAGRGPLEERLRTEAAELGVGGAVRFLGFLSDVRDLLEAADLYVQPSLCEAHPIALLEAKGFGLPVVASAVGGIPETVVDGQTGYVVPAREPEALAARLTQLLDSPEQRREFGARGRERVLAEFSQERMVTETIRVYERMLAGAAPRLRPVRAAS